MTDISRSELRTKVDQYLDSLIERFYKEVPFAQHQLKSDQINIEYYKRHNIETILRLRMKRTIDALTIHYFTKNDPVLAKIWSAYTEDEMLHDRMFAADLEKLGVSREQIYGTEPFFSTKLLQGYFYYGLEHENRPLASLCSSYFIEYTTVRTQPQWIENLEQRLGTDYVKGQRGHVSHDMDDDHIDVVWKVITTFLKTEEDEKEVFKHIFYIWRLFCMYFAELYESTVNHKPTDLEFASVAAE